MESEGVSIPKINFSGLVPGTTGWDTVEGEVMKALETYGCFEALYDNVTPELREALFDRAIAEVFSLPVEIKKGDDSSMNVNRYLGPSLYVPRESLGIDEQNIEGFTSLIWPQGNQIFCDTISTYTKHLKDLEQMIVLMLCRRLGIEKYYEFYIKGTGYGIQLIEYGVPFDQETKVALPAHLDPNFITILCQHRIEGLQVQTKEGEWINAVPTPNSFTVLIGEALGALFNGRLSATLHRVRITGNQKRNSALFGSAPRDDYLVQAPTELVDEEHPLLYKPYKFNEHLTFRFSDLGSSDQKTLKDFCGVNMEKVQA